MEISERIQPFWADFLMNSGRSAATQLYDMFHFGDREESASSLADLVLRGEKVATTSLLWEYETEGRRLPERGDLSIVTGWTGVPLCVIETSDVEVQAFEAVNEEFAAAEGEGDRSLEFWRVAHWRFFGRRCEELGRERSLRMPVVCERFKVVFAWTSE